MSDTTDGVNEVALQEAMQMLEATGERGRLETMLRAQRDDLFLQLRNTLKQADEQRLALALDEVLMPTILEGVGAVFEAFAAVVVRHFTLPELRELCAFHCSPEPRDQTGFDATPLGQKVLALKPTIDAEGSDATVAAWKLAVESAFRRHNAEVRSRLLIN